MSTPSQYIRYRAIKRLARETDGVTVGDLIALAPQNDPFYVGTPGEVEKGQWFANLWRKFGYTTGVHLRRVHYQLVSQSPTIPKPDGEPYANTENDWNYLGMAAKCARYLNLVRPGAFVDRRNPEPHTYAYYWDDPTPRYELRDAWNGLEITLPEFPDMPSFRVDGYNEGNLQPYHLEVWCEKTTMNDVLLPLCTQYDTNLVTGAGEMSITSAIDAVRRIEEADRPARLFYISDFDPAGYGMPISVARKLEYFLSDLGLDLDIQLEPIALTRAQVAAHDLPRTPIKRSELRRKSFIEAHGHGAVELDALEALHPGLLAEIVEKAILRYYDPDIADEADAVRSELVEALKKKRAEALEPFEDEIEELEEAFNEAVTAFEEAISDIPDRLDQLHPKVVKALEAIEVDLDDYGLPEPEEADELDDPLYSSARDYLAQLKSYKYHREGLS